VKDLKIIAADSSAAILNDKFEPLSIVATASVLINSPYREASTCLAEPIFADANNGHELVVYEADLCRKLIGKVRADIVHIDMSLGSIPLEELSPIQFTNMRIPTKAKQQLLRILPKLRKIATEIRQKYGVEVIAIGKESIPVRVAELTSGAHAILYACEKAVTEKKTVMLGLPSRCEHKLANKKAYLYSLMAAEHDIAGFADDTAMILEKVNIAELLNPCARGFRTLKITPRSG
jgi:hypothetical protein